MLPVTDWICAVVEHDLCCKLGKINDASLRIVDDESNLRFSDGTVQKAVIVNWTQCGERANAVLADSKTQISAVFTSKSLEQHRNDGPEEDLSSSQLKGRVVELSDYEVIFEYSLSEPQIHLCVKDFALERDGARAEAGLRYNRVKDHEEIAGLVLDLSEVMDAEQRHRYEDTPSIKSDNESIHSQAETESEASVESQTKSGTAAETPGNDDSDGEPAQESFVSQVPVHPTPFREPPRPGASERSAHLLSLLAPSGTSVSANKLNAAPGQAQKQLPLPAAARQLHVEGRHEANTAQTSGERGRQPLETTVHGHGDLSGRLPMYDAGHAKKVREGSVAEGSPRESFGVEQNEKIAESLDKRTRTPEKTSHALGTLPRNSRPERRVSGAEGAVHNTTSPGRQRSPQYASFVVEVKSPQKQGPNGLTPGTIGAASTRTSADDQPKSPKPLYIDGNNLSGKQSPEQAAPRKVRTTPTRKSQEIQSISPTSVSRQVDLPDKSRATITNDTSGCDSSARFNPWHGMTKIHSHDITISRDQEKLFDQGTRCWVPPDPGMGMPRGHVPPSLLRLWNQLALRRHAPKENEKQKLPPEETENSMTVASTGPASESESQDEGTPISWPPSGSEASETNPQDILPANSSPPRILFPTRDVQTRRKKHAITNDDYGKVSPVQVWDLQPAGKGRLLSETPATGVRQPMPPAERVDVPEAASDDESVMDTSVPCALQPSSQQVSSQEQHLLSPNPQTASLPVKADVQVFETPAAHANVRIFERGPSLEDTDSNREVVQRISLEPAGSSSEVQINNTYASIDNVPVVKTSQGATNSSSSLPSNPSQTVNFFGTQLGDYPSSFQFSQHQTQADVAADSVQSVTNQLKTSIAPPEASTKDERSSPTQSGQQQWSPWNTYRPKTATSIGRSSVEMNSTPTQSGLKRVFSGVASTNGSPQKRQRTTLFEAEDSGRHVLEQNESALISRRQSFIRASPIRSDAQVIFERFRDIYPDYNGDLSQFTTMCVKLQDLRSAGKLQRSFLWDDFIIVNSRDYPGYLQTCAATDTKLMPYEEYFISHVSRPSHKKRVLTAQGIDACVAHFKLTGGRSMASTPRMKSAGPTTSFTASVVRQLSDFHAHSFDTVVAEDTSASRTSVPATSPTSPEIAQLNVDNAEEDEQIVLSIESPQPQPETLTKPKSRSLDLDFGLADHAAERPTEQELDQLLEVVLEQPQVPSAKDLAPEDDDLDPFHETASIELGGDETRSHSPMKQAPTDVDLSIDRDLEQKPYTPDPNNGWFSRLSHMRLQHYTVPRRTWIDEGVIGYNAPFKAWARADLNLKTDRMRRGGAHYEIDEKGVVLVPPPAEGEEAEEERRQRAVGDKSARAAVEENLVADGDVDLDMA